MYEYRKLSFKERTALVGERKDEGRPWHAPPHFGQREGAFLITGTCYDHKCVMDTEARRTEWEAALARGADALDGVSVKAWIVLPNHYHLLAMCDLPTLGHWIGRLHNGKSTQWNREDGTPGRKVWHSFSDRSIRTERHYFATLNYVHANAIKHGCANDVRDWPWSSLERYLEKYGRDALAEWWKEYPVRDYGRGWDI